MRDDAGPAIILKWEWGGVQVGQIDIDSELVASRQQLEGTDATTVMMLNNGCLCCTVRDDLVDALGALVPPPPPYPS